MYAPLLTHLLLHDEAAEESAAVPTPAPAPSPPPKMPGKQQQLQLPTNLEQFVDHFTPLGTLGRGNMGTVFLVVSNLQQQQQQEQQQLPFALKVTRSLFSKKQRSHIEREILSSLHHPFLQTLHAHFEFGDHSLFLLDLCSGGDLNSLRHRQPEKRFSGTAARFYAAEVLLALEHLHKLGIVYRDLKPENILVQANGHIKLTDFDLSLRLGPAPQATNLQVQSTRPPTVGTLQQHIIAEADAEKLKKGLHVHTGHGIAFSRKCRALKESPKGGLMPVDGEAVYNVSTPRIRAAKQACNLCRLQCLGSNGKVCVRRRQKLGAAGPQSLIGPKETSKQRKLNRDANRVPHCTRSCLPLRSKRKAQKEAEERYICVVGTDEYVAPEVLRGEDHGFSMDWWSFGIFLYEMIYGCTPFKGSRSEGTLCNILDKEPDFPGMKTPAKHLIAQLLVKDPAARPLGGADDIKQHPFFCGVNWDSLPYICRPPFIPRPLCLSELEERYSAKLKTKRSDACTHREAGICKSWLDEIVESIEAADSNVGHTSSTQYSRSSSSAGFLSSSADGADHELRRAGDDDVDAIFSSAEWSSELEAGKHTPLVLI